MSLIYRAVWEDRRVDISSIARETFEQWVAEKSDGLIEAPIVGLAVGGDQSARMTEVRTGDETALFATHHHELGDATWTLTLGVVGGGPGARRSVWVDLEHTAEDPYGRPPPVSAPRIVKRLISSGDAHLGGTLLSAEPRMITAENARALAQHILDPARPVPIIAFSENRNLSGSDNRAQVREAADHLAGAAIMADLHPSAEPILEALLPPKMALFGGAARIYLPDIDPVDPKPWRHRWYGGDHRSKRPLEFPQLLARELSARMALRRPPKLSAFHLEAMPLSDIGYFSELLQRRDIELERVELQFERSETDRRILQSELNQALTESFFDRHSDSGEPVVRHLARHEFASVREVLEASASLAGVSTERTVVEASDEDDSTAAGHLAATRLRCSLTALHEFSRTSHVDFAEWVERARPVGVTAETVTIRKSVDTDTPLPVDPRVSPNGSVRMGNQIRSSALGDNELVIRFLDDRDGATQLIHVGYVGSERSPHPQRHDSEA